MSKQRQFPRTKELVYYQNRTDPVEIIVFDGETYKEQNTMAAIESDDFDPDKYVELSRLRQHRRSFGDYPWDHWKEWALQDGVEPKLAELGRSLIREADQHNWSPELQAECGWSDSGAAMIELALQDPEAARKRWAHLMETDGGRVYWDGDDFRSLPD